MSCILDASFLQRCGGLEVHEHKDPFLFLGVLYFPSK